MFATIAKIIGIISLIGSAIIFLLACQSFLDWHKFIRCIIWSHDARWRRLPTSCDFTFNGLEFFLWNSLKSEVYLDNLKKKIINQWSKSNYINLSNILQFTLHYIYIIYIISHTNFNSIYWEIFLIEYIETFIQEYIETYIQTFFFNE